jgi:HEXXH motif-containing protein
MPPIRLDPDADRAWQPGLARQLVDGFARAHPAYRSADYGSAAWLGLDDSADQHGSAAADLAISAAAQLQASSIADLHAVPVADSGPASVPGLAQARFEILKGAARDRYTALGLTLADTAPEPSAAALFGDALDLLDAGSALREAVEALVRRVHPLVARGPGYDSSHSDPELPFSIFVSIPAGENAAVPRLAESILHEAMHLQLSLLEGREALVCEPPAGERAATGYSPWQKCERPIGGLVHGLFVFRVIFDWLEALAASRPHDDDIAGYAARRRGEIAQEIQSLGDLAALTALTAAGRQLVSGWLAGVRIARPGAVLASLVD